MPDGSELAAQGGEENVLEMAVEKAPATGEADLLVQGQVRPNPYPSTRSAVGTSPHSLSTQLPLQPSLMLLNVFFCACECGVCGRACVVACFLARVCLCTLYPHPIHVPCD